MKYILKKWFVEIEFRMLLKYENTYEAKYVVTEFKLYDDKKMYINTYNNNDFISYGNYVFINKNIFYSFEKDIKILKIVITFRMVQNKIIKIWYEPVNTDRLIIKHFGN